MISILIGYYFLKRIVKIAIHELFLEKKIIKRTFMNLNIFLNKEVLFDGRGILFYYILSKLKRDLEVVERGLALEAVRKKSIITEFNQN